MAQEGSLIEKYSSIFLKQKACILYIVLLFVVMLFGVPCKGMPFAPVYLNDWCQNGYGVEGEQGVYIRAHLCVRPCQRAPRPRRLLSVFPAIHSLSKSLYTLKLLFFYLSR